MATALSSNTFSNVYRDDYRDSDNFHRILFNGGKALQARELTQSQTIINKELERFGSNIFLNGGAVTGGNLTVNNKVEFIKLASSSITAVKLDNLVGTYYRETTSPNIIVKVLEVYHNTLSDWSVDTLIVEYVNTGTTGGTATDSVRIGNSKTLQRIKTISDTTAFGDTTNYPNITTATSGASGLCCKAYVEKGSFFVQGHFVFAKAQSIFVSQYTQFPTDDIGFQVTEDIVTTTDDQNLYDNSNPAGPNLASPGADRYRITLALKTRTAAGSNNFIYLARVVKGVIADEVKTDNSYNTINDLMAQRTKEESGNYTVKGFDLNIRSVDSDNVNYSLSTGTAYVDGYRVELDQKSIVQAKPVTTQTVSNELTSSSWGNYVLGYGKTGSAATQNKGLPNITRFEKMNLCTAVNHGGDIIGTARCRGIYKDESNNYRFYLFDIRMKPTNASGIGFHSVKSFGTTAADYVNVVLEGGVAVLKGTNNNTLLWPLPKVRPTFGGIVGQNMTVQRKYTVTTGGGVTSVSGHVGGGMGAGVGIDAFTNPTQWIVSGDDSCIEPASVSITGGGSTFGMTGLKENTTYEVIAQVSVTGNTDVARRAKGLSEYTVTKAWPGAADSDGAGLKFFSLDKPDIYSVKSIKLADSAGVDLSANFTIDNGQRDNYYGIGRLIPNANATLPTANIFVRFQAFTHTASTFDNGSVGAQKCYFDAGSYSGLSKATSSIDSSGCTYGTIPDYTMGDGTKINLRDYLDFRPVATLQHTNDSARPTGTTGSTSLKDYGNYANITFDSNGAGGNPLIHLLPQSGGTVETNNTYYLPRKDRLVVATKNSGGERIPRGSIQYLQGVPSFEPNLPAIPNGSMPLYNIDLNANTIDKKDLFTEKHVNKRFQMSDIARLEQRINKIEETTSLSLLELDTTTLAVLDSSGNARTKAGFLVDNFKDYTFTDVSSGEQRASIDPMQGLLNPLASPISNRLFFDSSIGGTTLKISGRSHNSSVVSTHGASGDMLLLPMSDSAVSFINQDAATTTENINPFAVITSNGHIELSPSTDTWVETQWAADDIVSGGTEQVQGPAQITSQSLGNWANNWIGQPTSWNIGSVQRVWTSQGNRQRTDTRSVTVRGNISNRIEQIGDRVLNISVLPFMRSIKVYFRAQGLRRGTRHWPFFGNTSIANYTKQESFSRWARRNEDVGNLYTNNTSHPNTATNLVSDSNGLITGSFIIPSNSSLKFNTGAQVFKLLDISAANDSDAISSANTVFTSTGTLETRQRIMQSTRVEEFFTLTESQTSVWWVDPLAQSFNVNIAENPNGVYITKCRIYFATKPDNFGVPVQCQIRPMVGGVPHNSPLPGAIKFLTPANVTATAMAGTNMTTIRGAGTDFIFDEPIYLAPGQEYAVVLLAETTEYTVYISETYEFLVGTTAERVARQPTLGSLFKSQNGSTWTPEQDQDLMFHLYRAEFSASGTGYLKNTTPSNHLLSTNPIQTVSADSDIRIFHNNHGFAKGDHVQISGVTGTLASVAAASINGQREVTLVDPFSFSVKAVTAPNDNLRGGGTAVQVSNNIVYNNFVPQVQTLQLAPTTITVQAKHTTGKSYGSSTRRSGTSQPSSTYAFDASWSDVVLNEINSTDDTKALLASAVQDSAGFANSLLLKINMATTDTKVSPAIDLQRTNFIGFENRIDNSVLSVGTNVAETNAVDGTSASKHITRPVILEESAVGLKILFAANRPGESSFEVYYRTGTTDDDLNQKDWVLKEEDTSNPADNDNSTFRQYEYMPGGQGGLLEAFTKFQVKIVMNSSNQSKVPTIKDLRVIAMVT